MAYDLAEDDHLSKSPEINEHSMDSYYAEY